MSGAKEIRTKIASVKSTRKITDAMQMVAASKMRKSQVRMEASKPYAESIAKVVSSIAGAHSEYRHKYLEEREVKKIGLIVVSTDRGLCGGLNTNLFKKALQLITEKQEQGIGVEMALIGSKASAFFRSTGADVVATAANIGEEPTVEQLIGSVKVMLDAFDAGEIDKIYLLSNEYVNTMTQSPRAQQLVPVEPNVDTNDMNHWDYIYEPGAEEILHPLLVRYVESQVYQGVVENTACEQAARMIAMKAATDNAGNMIDELQLVYNKARQTAITQELSEIVSGAAAV